MTISISPMPEPETTDDSKQPHADLRDAAIAVVSRLVDQDHVAYFAGRMRARSTTRFDAWRLRHRDQCEAG